MLGWMMEFENLIVAGTSFDLWACGRADDPDFRAWEMFQNSIHRRP
jgi:hypothetical protein